MAQLDVLLRGKLVVLGDCRSGKSSLIKSFVSDGQKTVSSYQMTVSSEITTKTVSIPESNASVELYIFDTPGNSIFESTLENHCKGASSFLVLYDVTNKSALNNIGKWLKVVESIRASKSSPVIGALVASKCDTSDRQITSQQGNEIAKSLDLKYFECLLSTDAIAPFHYIARGLCEEYEAHVKNLAAN